MSNINAELISALYKLYDVSRDDAKVKKQLAEAFLHYSETIKKMEKAKKGAVEKYVLDLEKFNDSLFRITNELLDNEDRRINAFKRIEKISKKNTVSNA